MVSAGAPGECGSTRRDADEGSPAAAAWPRAIPGWATVVCAVAFIACELATEAWFRRAEPARAVPERAFTLAALGSGWAEEKIPARVQSILRYDSGKAYILQKPGGARWWVYDLEWRQGSGGSALARFHSPEVCLPAAGFKLVERGPLIHPAGPRAPFRMYEFERRGARLFLFSSFYASSESGRIATMDQFDLTWAKRVELARAGRRPVQQRGLQVVISGAISASAARQEFSEFVRESFATPGT